MNRDLSKLTLGQLIALGFQNKIPMKYLPKNMTQRTYITASLDALEVIKGLETPEYSSEASSDE